MRVVLVRAGILRWNLLSGVKVWLVSQAGTVSCSVLHDLLSEQRCGLPAADALHVRAVALLA